jgi:hypothetical protein
VGPLIDPWPQRWRTSYRTVLVATESHSMNVFNIQPRHCRKKGEAFSGQSTYSVTVFATTAEHRVLVERKRQSVVHDRI